MKLLLDDSSQKILKDPLEEFHIVQIYKDEDHLANTVGLYLSSALFRNDAILMIATNDHWKLFREKLHSAYPPIDLSEHENRIRFLDAAETLRKIMRNGKPDWGLFNTLFSGIIQDLRSTDPSMKIMAYGEMVNLLWERGKTEAAVSLEEFWNDLFRTHPFSLFCAYSFSNIADEIAVNKIKGICKAHSHFIPSENHPHVAEATQNALHEILGSEKNGILKKLLETDEHRSPLPDYLSTLFWLEKNMPRTAAAITSAAQRYLFSASNSLRLNS